MNLVYLIIALTFILMLGSTLLIRNKKQVMDLDTQIEMMIEQALDELQEIKEEIEKKQIELEYLKKQIEEVKPKEVKSHYTREEAKEIDWKNVTFK